nr:TRAP transporter substrate-binding protein [Methylobacterium sp. WSM2598]
MRRGRRGLPQRAGWTRRRLIGVLLGLLPALVAGPAAAQVRWVMATEYPASTVSGVGLTTFARRVSERTQGAVEVANALDNALKISSGEMIRAAQDGRISGGDAFAGPLEATDPIFGLASLPFVVQSVEAARDLNARARPLYARALAARGLTLLYMTIWPPTGLWTARPLAGPDDLRAMAIRAYDPTSAEVMRAAGAKAEFMPFSEAVAKVRSRDLDGILTSGDGGAGRRLWDDLRYFTAINYAIPISLAVVRTDAVEALPPAQREAVLAAAAETEQSQFALLATRTADNYARMRANGVAIAEPAPPALLASLRAGAAGPIRAWARKVPEEAVAILDGAGPR